MKYSVWLMPSAGLALLLLLVLALTAAPPLLDAGELNGLDIFAYRDWQATGVQLELGQPIQIRAQGRWSYTPGEWNGPGGHTRFRAPSFYPVPSVPGGALIGRVGEHGEIFFVGDTLNLRAPLAGQLYLRIDDDILTDNEGKVTVEVKTEAGAASAQPTLRAP